MQVLLDGAIAKPDSSIWDLPLLTSHDKKLLSGVKGVPGHLLPSTSNSRQARPKIMSSRGFQLPPGVPGLLSPGPDSPVLLSMPAVLVHVPGSVSWADTLQC